MTHITDIPTIKPESVAFISYVMADYNIPFDALITTPVNIPFAKAVIKHAMLFYAETEMGFRVMEALIVYAGVDEGMASALIVRRFDHGVLDEDSVAFVQFVMHPYHREQVLKTIKAVPQIKLATH